MNCRPQLGHGRTRAAAPAPSRRPLRRSASPSYKDSSSDKRTRRPPSKRRTRRSESIEDLIEDPRRLLSWKRPPPGEGPSQVIDVLSPAKTARAPSPPAFDEEGDDESDGGRAPSPKGRRRRRPRKRAPPRHSHRRRRRRGPEPAEADARDQEGDGDHSDDGEDQGPLVLREEVTPPTTTCTTRLRISATSSKWETEDRLGLQIDPRRNGNPSRRCLRPVRRVLKND